MRYIKIEVTSKRSATRPPRFIGSMVRGCFGVSLKKIVCINPSYECGGCFAKDDCIYFDFFEKKNHIHGFRLDIELDPQKIDFSIYLFEKSCDRYPYILSAVHKMFYDTGFGKKREKLPLERIVCNDTLIFENGEFLQKKIESALFSCETFSKDIRLSFITPLRIKYENRLLTQTPSLRHLIQSIYNRYLTILGLKPQKLPFEPKGVVGSSDIKFLELQRYSNRQKTKMNLGGIIGEMEIKEIDKESFELLKLAEIIGIGKQTVFGLGKIKVTDMVAETK